MEAKTTELVSYNVRKSNMTLESIPFIGLEAIDHLVLIAVLLCSVALSLNGTFNSSNKTESKNESSTEDMEAETDVSIQNGDEVIGHEDETISNDSQRGKLFSLVMAAVVSISPLFVNTLSLFGLSGEIYANDTSVLMFMLGLLISIGIITFSGILNLLSTANISTLSSYLRRRYSARAASYLVAGSAIARHIFGGALNVHVASLAAGAASGISATAVAFVISATAALCVSVGGIQTERSYSIGSLWLVILTVTTFVVLCMTTADYGGIKMLFDKADANGKISLPSLSAYPWEHHSYWGTTILGIFLGLQIFLMARASLKHLPILKSTLYATTLVIVWFIIALWVGLATWAGICSSVTFSDIYKNRNSTLHLPPNADGSLAVLITIKLSHLKGFRGFFLASLIAASISGLTRRFNQMISVVWETWFNGGSLSFGSRNFSGDLRTLRAAGANEDFLREIRWSYEKKRSCASFMFKAPAGLMAGSICIMVLWQLQGCQLGCWELWQGLIGVLSGAILGAILIGMFFPCFPHMSVVLGLLIGWCMTSYLIITNISRAYQPHDRITAYGNKYIAESRAVEYHRNVPKIITTQGDNYEKFINNLRGHNATGSNFGKKVRQWVFVGGQAKEVILDSHARPRSPTTWSRKASKRKRATFAYSSYCYYGLVGTLSCIISALLFTVATNRCKQKEFPTELLHPAVRVFQHRPTPAAATTATSTIEMVPTTANQKTAFDAFQEKAGF